MIAFEQALEILGKAGRRLLVEEVELGSALGRVLALPVVSPIDSPPFDKAAMDGFAVAARRGAEAGGDSWRVRETVAAGSATSAPVSAGECVRIMTGAPLPPGTDRVIRKEFTEESSGTVRAVRQETGDNVVRRGENLREGNPVLEPRILAPQDIGTLAASGVARVPVAAVPRVAVLCTGSELRAPGDPLGPGEIYNSNSAQLAAQLALMRSPCRELGAVADSRPALEQALAAAIGICDVLLLTGGVSEGDFDYVPDCLEALAAEILFHGVAIKPGKPTLYAKAGDTHIFGLPGNPVSTFVIFEIFVKPLLYRLMGIEWTPVVVRAPLAEQVSRRDAERDEFRPVRLQGGSAMPIPYHGSAHLNALVGAEGLIRIRRGTTVLPAGESVDVRLL